MYNIPIQRRRGDVQEADVSESLVKGEFPMETRMFKIYSPADKKVALKLILILIIMWI